VARSLLVDETMGSLGVVAAVCLGALASTLVVGGVKSRRRTAREEGPGPGRGPAAEPARPARVVVVDHDPAFVALLSRLLDARGHEVVTAASPLEARQLAAAFPGGVDVVVASLELGEHHGVAAVGEVRRSSPRARGVILSGEVRHADDVSHLLETGVDLVRKPVAPEALVEAVERAISRCHHGHGKLH